MSTPCRAPAHPAAALVALRGLLLVAVVAAGGVGVLALASPPLDLLARPHHTGDQVQFTAVLQTLCAMVTLLGWAWLQIATVLVTAAALARACRRPRLAGHVDRACDRAVPGSWRRVLLAVCGVALSTGTTVLPAAAAPQPPPQTLPAPVAVLRSPALDGLPLPDRPVGDQPQLQPTVALVRPGDSLWTMARRLLRPGASDHEISVAWHRLAHVNRDVLGSDPGLIHPGARLRVPAHLDRRDTP